MGARVLSFMEVGRVRWIPLALALAGLVVSGALSIASQDTVPEELEARRIAEVLHLKPGEVVADVGAGDGFWTVRLARRVGPDGQVFSTEIDPDLLTKIRDKAEEEALRNITIVLGREDQTGLPRRCCDAILLRNVYHHLAEPPAMLASLSRAIRPGGLVAIIDFESAADSRPASGVAENRLGHGMPRDLLIEEMTAVGFEVVSQVENWNKTPWRGQLVDGYCVVFRAPAQPPGR